MVDLSSMGKEDVAWAGGLFEGEGSFAPEVDRRIQKVYLQMALVSTDEDVVRRFHEIVGHGNVYGPIGNGDGHKPYWRWRTRGQNAIKVGRVLLPHLGSRRRERFLELESLNATRV
jgi:hypothetical protein